MAESIAEVGYLAGICGSEDGTDWEKVLIDSSRRLAVAIASAVAQECQLYGWDGDSWEKLQVDASKYLKVTLPLEEALGARAYGNIGGGWQKQPLQFGYSGRYAEANTETGVSAGSHTLSLTAVPEGEIWVAQAIMAEFWGGTVTAMRLYLYDGSTNYFVQAETSPVASVPTAFFGAFALKEGDKIRAEFIGCADTPAIKVSAWGYKMDIDL